MIEPRADKSPTPGGGPTPGRLHRFEHEAMACVFEVHIQGADAGYARHAAQAAFQEVDRLEQLLSRFVPHSDIARIASLEPGRSLPVSVETIDCLRLASEMQAETDGAFDVAFRSAGPRPRDLPPLVLDPANHAVAVQVPGVSLDLGGLGKGYAIDRMAEVVREWGISAALLHAGQSTVYALSATADEAGWRVGLRTPDDYGNVFGEITLGNRALSGSGQRLHGRHIRDPRTGRPAEQAQAAWALAPTAAMADALSTAFMVPSPVEVERVCGRLPGVSAILLCARDGGAEVLCFGECDSLLDRAGGSG